MPETAKAVQSSESTLYQCRRYRAHHQALARRLGVKLTGRHPAAEAKYKAAIALLDRDVAAGRAPRPVTEYAKAVKLSQPASLYQCPAFKSGYDQAVAGSLDTAWGKAKHIQEAALVRRLEELAATNGGLPADAVDRLGLDVQKLNIYPTLKKAYTDLSARPRTRPTAPPGPAGNSDDPDVPVSPGKLADRLGIPKDDKKRPRQHPQAIGGLAEGEPGRRMDRGQGRQTPRAAVSLPGRRGLVAGGRPETPRWLIPANFQPKNFGPYSPRNTAFSFPANGHRRGVLRYAA